MIFSNDYVLKQKENELKKSCPRRLCWQRKNIIDRSVNGRFATNHTSCSLLSTSRHLGYLSHMPTKVSAFSPANMLDICTTSRSSNVVYVALHWLWIIRFELCIEITLDRVRHLYGATCHTIWSRDYINDHWRNDDESSASGTSDVDKTEGKKRDEIIAGKKRVRQRESDWKWLK